MFVYNRDGELMARMPWVTRRGIFVTRGTIARKHI